MCTTFIAQVRKTRDLIDLSVFYAFGIILS